MSSNPSNENLTGDHSPSSSDSPVNNLERSLVLSQPDHEVAYNSLDALFQNDKIGGAMVAELRAIYGKMAAEMEHCRSYEKSLVDKARVLSDELDKQRGQLAQCDDQDFTISNSNPSQNTGKSENPNEVIQLRNKLMKQMNNLAMHEERGQENSYTIEALTEHRRLLKLEKDRQPDPVILVKQSDKLTQEIQSDLRLQASLQKGITQTKEFTESTEKDLKEQQRLIELSIEKQDFVTAEMVANSTVDGMHPAELSRMIDKLGRTKEELGRQQTLQQETLAQQKLTLTLKNSESESRQETYDQTKRTLRESESKNENKEREYATLRADFNRDKARENDLISRKEDLEIKARQYDQEKNHLHDQLSRKKREYDRESRLLKKKQLQVNVANDQLEQQQRLLIKSKAEVDNFPRDEQAEKGRKDLTNEVEQLKRKKLGEEMRTKEEQEATENLIEMINKLSKEHEQECAMVNEQSRMHHIKSDEREQKARDVARAKNRLKHVHIELQSADLELLDQKKRAKELSYHQDEFAKKYEQIKNEKNKYVNLIQSSSQKREELKDKFRILANEIEVLQQRLGVTEKELNKRNLKNSASETQRDQLQVQMNKHKTAHLALEEELDQAKLDCSKLSNQNNLLEEEMLKLRRKYESAVNSRNQRGIQLIEREEEVCVFYEKLNIQDGIIRNGDVKLEELNDEVEFLRTQVAEEQRQIDILKKHRPELKNLKNDLVDLQIELSRVQDKTVKLEHQLESPDQCKNRIRLLSGEDLTPDKLEGKLAQLELRLAQKEEQSLEKSLVLEQVVRLLSNLEDKQSRAVDDKRSLSEQCAGHKGQLDNMNRKTLALISEIAMEQANNISLQEKVKKLDTTNQIANERFFRGEPPTSDMLEEWKKLVRDEQRKSEEKLAKHVSMLELQKHILPGGGGITAAEPRPNAYLIPVENADHTTPSSHSNLSDATKHQHNRPLPLPKPYGSMAPFKPQPAGAAMRHIRKPKVKPLEI